MGGAGSQGAAGLRALEQDGELTAACGMLCAGPRAGAGRGPQARTPTRIPGSAAPINCATLSLPHASLGPSVSSHEK